MDFLELAKKRYSARKYDGKRVEEDKLDKILEAARVAPSGSNKQPVKLLVLKDEDGLEKVSKAARIYGAPLVIVACGDHNIAGVIPFNNKSVVDIDTSIATDHMMMEATSLGLDSVWICSFNPEVISREFDLSDNIEPINVLAIGYGVGEPASPNRHDKTRKSLDDLIL